MYVRHPPEDHDEVYQRRKAGQKYTPPDYRPGWKPDGASIPPPNNETGNNESESKKLKLVLSDKVKEVLCTTYMMSDADVDHIIAQSEK